MSRKYPNGGDHARAHWARVNSRRYEAWLRTHPAKAREAFQRGTLNWTIDRIELAASKAAQRTRPAASTTNGVAGEIKGAVAAGVTFAGAVSIAKNFHDVSAGKQDLASAAKVMAKDVAAAGASALAVSAAAEGIRWAARTANVGTKLAKGSLPVTIASGAADMAVQAYQGTLTTRTAAVTVARTAGGWAGAKAGAAGGAGIGTFFAPVTGGASIPIGAFVGALVGGLGGSFGAGKAAERALM